jgi:hypothetical protein
MLISNATPYGFRVVGDCRGRRRAVDAAAALAGYAACDPRAEVHGESYLSAFTFGRELLNLMNETGSTRGYGGPCGLAFLWWDIDRADDLDAALLDARRLAAALLHRYRALEDDDLLVLFSGAKGFHIGLPAIWKPAPSPTVPAVARRFAEAWAERAGAKIDSAVYDPVRLFRAPNSRHPRTGLHKRRLLYDELLGLPIGRIAEMAAAPVPFDVPTPVADCTEAAADWSEAERAVAQATADRAKRRAEHQGPVRLQRETLDFIRDGAEEGDRHARLFRAAANLAEFGCTPTLAHVLLSDAGLDCGLPPADVRRQIDCGLAHAARQSSQHERVTT